MHRLLASSAAEPDSRRAISLRVIAGLPRGWHLTSLDAPTVAAAWCAAFLHAAGLRVVASQRWPIVFLMLATWLCYVGDRTLDARLRASTPRLRERHRFYGMLWQQQRPWLLGAICSAAVGCAATALYELTGSLLREYVALTTAAVLYFAWVHWGARRNTAWFAKEALVAIIFAFGCVLPAFDVAGAAVRWRLTAPGALLIGLCWLNCVAIERWEQLGAPLEHFHRSTRWAARNLFRVAVGGAAMAFVLAILGGSAPLAGCLASSFLLLAALEWRRRMLPAPALRILADVALLTPLAWLVVARGLR